MKILSIILDSGEKYLINEDQVCSIQKSNKSAIIKMSNNDEFHIIDPTYEQWENDELIRND